jgi:LuxR family transcriptional regulator, maltose regulon positive regulatory protein
MAAVQAPEALEDASWAAWWRDDAAAVFDAREAAFRLYRTRGQTAGAARMATWLACDHLDFNGASSVAGGWLRRARRLLESQPESAEHGWLAFHEGYLAEGSGDSARACDLARQAADIGRRLDIADLQMLGLALEGASLVACAQIDAGMRCLDEATATALEAEADVPIANAWTFCFLVSACVAVRDFKRAFEWCDRIAEFAARYHSRYMLGFCRAYYGAVHIWRGEWTEAETLLEAAVEDLACSRPAYAADALVWLAELRRRQGRTDEALQLLDKAGDWSRPRVCRARLALDAGDAVRAIELAERCLRQTPKERTLDYAPALEVLVQARARRGKLDAAHDALNALR